VGLRPLEELPHLQEHAEGVLPVPDRTAGGFGRRAASTGSRRGPGSRIRRGIGSQHVAGNLLHGILAGLKDIADVRKRLATVSKEADQALDDAGSALETLRELEERLAALETTQGVG